MDMGFLMMKTYIDVVLHTRSRLGQEHTVLSEAKGEILVPVSVTDAVGTEVIKAEMLWAWIPKSRIKS